MSRHRNVRSYNYDEAAQFIYSRQARPSAFGEPLEEEDYEYEEEEEQQPVVPSTQKPRVGADDQARLYSCLEQMREVLGDSVSEQEMTEAVLKCNFSAQEALDMVFSQNNTARGSRAKNQTALSSGKSTKGALLYSVELVANNNTESVLAGDTADSVVSSSSCLSSQTEKLESHSRFAAENSSMTSMCTTNEIVLYEDQKMTDSCLEVSLTDLISRPPLSQACDSFGEQTVNMLPAASNLAQLVSESGGSSFESFLSDTPTESLSEKHSCSEDVATCCTSSTSDHLSLSACQQTNSNCSAFKPLGLSEFKSILTSGNFSKSVPSVWCSDLEDNSILNSSSHTVQPEAVSLAELIQENKEDCLCQQDSSQPEAVSLAELVQESKDCHCQQHGHHFQNPEFLTLGGATVDLGSLSLSELTSTQQVQVEQQLGSLSSLVSLETFAVSKLENLSLSDLIAGSVEVGHESEVNKDPILHEDKLPLETVEDVKSNDLMRSHEPLADLANLLSHSVNDDAASQSNNQWSPKEYKAGNKVCISKKRTRTVSWTKSLTAKPSSFALTLCFQYPRERAKKHFFTIYKAFRYSRQVPEVKKEEKSPFFKIAAFDFNTPSPDDIVQVRQKKAFIRD
ncbi:HBS1-like protein isoform X2 [Protopterus annectens]|uniref:HBS1-like protein isoform X2 n=1 Tax=Protopterus annectens TaxID=7888 RepID=UPI001CF94E35|nr:HBS1-like protein isoform X2 [Protopterus annectens]